MPEISRFYGIVLTMYADDHNPPHIHARYAEYKCKVNINTGEVIAGKFPGKQLKLVQAWLIIHHKELINNWEERNKDKPNFFKIDPLT